MSSVARSAWQVLFALSEQTADLLRRHFPVLGLLGLYVLGAGVIIYYGFLEPPWLSYPNPEFVPRQESYHAGEAATIVVTRCNNSSQERQYNISHVLVRLDPATEQCPRRTILQPGLVPIDAGCVTEDSSANVIPRTTCSGRYQVEGHAEIQGTVKTTLVPWHSKPFNVLPPLKGNP